MTTAQVGPRFVLVETSDDSPGKRIQARRIALGASVRQLAVAAGIDRGTLTDVEADLPTVRAATRGRVEATLSRMEEEAGMDTADMVTSTIRLPDGTTVMFAGTADGVAEAASKYLAERDGAEPT